MLPLHFLQSRRFSEMLFKGEKYELLDEVPNLYKRIKLFGVTIDVCVSENEPKITPVKGLHAIAWHVPKDKDVYENIKIPSWYGPFGKYLPAANPVLYIDTQDPDYFKKWSKRKQTYRHAWLRQLEKKELSIFECDLETFLHHYLESNFSKRIKRFNEKQMKDLQEIYKKDMFFYLVKDMNSEKIVAGLCTLHDYETEQIVKQYSFLDKHYKNIGVGLVDFCISSDKKAGLKYLSLTLINTRGHNERGWRGFTKFKLEFNPIVTYFRQSYFRIMWNR